MFSNLFREIDNFKDEFKSICEVLNKDNSISAYYHLSIKIEKDNIINFKKCYINLERSAKDKGFYIPFSISKIDKLISNIDKLREIFSIIEREKKRSHSVHEIKCLLNEIIKELNWVNAMLKQPFEKAERYQDILTSNLKSILIDYLGNPIDLDTQLEFLSKIVTFNLNIVEIKLINNRSYKKDFAKALEELLAIAEYYLYRNKIEILKQVIHLFWAIYFIKERSNENNPLPPWEGIRLVKEINFFEDK